MSNFALETTDSYGDVISSINYLLSTSNVLDANVIVTSANALVANVSSGQITTAADPAYVSYLYQYLHVRYADNATGSVNFSTSPTNRLFFGLLNSNSPIGSSNPADYIYTQVVGGFGTTKFFFYSVLGGRQLLINVTTGLTNNFLQAVDGVPIDLDLVTAVANVVITANNIVASTITGNQLAANTVATTNITTNAVSFFGSYQNNAGLAFFGVTPNTFYSFTNTVTVTTTVSNTKTFITGQVSAQWITNCLVAPATLTSNIGIRMRDVSQNVTYILGSQDLVFSITSTGIGQGDQDYYETGFTLTLANVGEYGFDIYGYYGTSGNVTAVAIGYENTRNAVQNLKR
jgi:hypothetical protein